MRIGQWPKDAEEAEGTSLPSSSLSPNTDIPGTGSIFNDKLAMGPQLEAVEDTICQNILPELTVLREEQSKHASHKSDKLPSFNFGSASPSRNPIALHFEMSGPSVKKVKDPLYRC